jgi:hypothetical protein
LKLSGIIWLDEIVEKIERKHRVTQDEVREILRDHRISALSKKDTEEARMFTRRWASLMPAGT